MALEDIIASMDSLINDPTVPRNVKKALEEAKRKLESNEEKRVKVSDAIYTIQPHIEDPNLPMHARTALLSILSSLEAEK